MSKPPGSANRPRRPGQPYVRKNDRIRAREVRLIGPDGAQIGVTPRDDALALAKKYGLDLVEIAPNARPPVCRILDFGKFKYEQSKRGKDKQHAAKLKEVKFRVRIEQHDYMTKLRRAESFLFKGSKVKMTLMFRGREMEHTDLGFEVMKRAAVDLEHVAVKEGEPKLNGRFVTMVISPLPQNKRKLKYTAPDDEVHDDEDDHDDEHHEDEDDGHDEK